MYIKHVDEITKEEIKAAVKTTKQVLIGSGEGPNFAMRKFTIETGGSMPMHTNTVEHEQIVLGGKAEVIIGGEKFEAKKNDVVFIPAGVPHCYKTIGSEAFEFICVVPNEEDVMEVIKEA